MVRWPRRRFPFWHLGTPTPAVSIATPRERIMSIAYEQSYETMTVADLVRAAQAGDRNAFGELFERYRDHILAMALRRLGNYGDAEELCQEVFIQALES